jgi:hypothetical protein
MDLNFSILNSLPPLPHLFCIKNTGPFESDLIRILIRINKGNKLTMPIMEQVMSNILLKNEYTLFCEFNVMLVFSNFRAVSPSILIHFLPLKLAVLKIL